MIFNPLDYTVVFLSFDEPNCEENYQHLLTLCPSALRVHGVKGSDTAHKECAKLAQTDNVIIVDGDNKVKPEFFTKTFNLVDSVDLSTTVLSYSAFNPVNGNSYGNGGIKVWPVSKLQTMQTHENSADKNSVDFDFKQYLELNFQGSITDMTASPLQAFRAGFREGTKLSTEDGVIVPEPSCINWKNRDRLWRWMHIGSDVQNGVWAIYGARLGYYVSIVHKGDISKVKDFDHMTTVFHDADPESLTNEIQRLGDLISKGTHDTSIVSMYTPEQSKTFRESIPCTIRSEQNFIKYQFNEPPQVFFISNGEANADKNFQRVLEKAPKAKRIDRVKGIHSAVIEAAKLATTDYFWVVDGDASLVDKFDFTFNVSFYEEPKVRVWRSKNPVNNLVYGNGGVKLLPRMQTLLMDTSSVDMTTGISKLYEPIFNISNITEFNTDSFSAWRSGFRECVKLASLVIDKQNTKETQDRLNTWCTVGLDKPFGKETIAGAIAGKEYGTINKSNREALIRINDYEWLREQFNRLY